MATGLAIPSPFSNEAPLRTVRLFISKFHLPTTWLKNAQLDQLYAVHHYSPQLTILKEIKQFLKAKDYFNLT